MKRIKKIFLLFLTVVYVTVVYGRLMYSQSFYTLIVAKGSQEVYDSGGKLSKKTHLIQRKHLPLIKHIEIGKLYPVIKFDRFQLSKSDFKTILFTKSTEIYSSEYTYHHKNKSPPVSL